MSSPSASPDRIPPKLWSALGLTTASQITATSSVLALTTIPTIVASALGISPHIIGYQVSLIYAAGVIFSMLAGGFVKRLGAGRVGQLALLCAGVGFLGLATGTAPGIALASVIIGIGYALNNPSSSHILALLAPPHRRNLIFSIKQAGVPLGGVLAALTVPFLAQTIGWQWALAALGLIPIALAALYETVRRQWDHDRSPDSPLAAGVLRRQKELWQHPALRGLAILGFLYSGVQLMISTFVVAMLIEQFSWPVFQAALAAAALQAAGAVGRIAWGLLADKTGSGFGVLAIVGALAGISLLGFSLIGNLTSIGILSIVISGLTGSGWNGVLLAETAHASPGKGTYTGDVLTYTFVGVMVGPAFYATLYTLFHSFTVTFMVFSLQCFLGAALALGLHMRARHNTPPLDAEATSR